MSDTLTADPVVPGVYDPETGFSRPVNLGDPVQLAEQCRQLSDGMDQQARASTAHGTANAGHPNPTFFYRWARDVLAYAAAQITKDHPPPKPAVPEDPKPETAKPAHPGKKS